MSDAVLGVWGDVEAKAEPEFNEWYHREHVPQRVGMPGWRSGRRYKRVDRGRYRYVALYELDSLACFDDPVYRDVLDRPTEWTRRMMPSFRNFVRASCRVRFVSGEVAGGFIATVRFDPPESEREAVVRWIAGQALHDLRERPGITRVQFLEADSGRSLTPTTEQQLRVGPDGRSAFVAIIEGTDRAAVEAALAESGIEGGLAARQARDVEVGVYQLMFALTR